MNVVGLEVGWDVDIRADIAAGCAFRRLSC